MDQKQRSAGTRAGLIGGPAVAVMMLASGPLPLPGLDGAAWAVAALTAWMAIWWVSEAVPLAVTALLPLPLLPLLGVSGIEPAAAPYASPLVFLFLGGFLLAAAVQQWGLHRRLALSLVALAGARPDRMVGSAMLGAAFLSMWISNTATAAMMLPIALSIMNESVRPEDSETAEDSQTRGFRMAMLLAIAFGCNIGGMGTLIGTPPNALLAALLREQGVDIGFAEWMVFALPVVIVLLWLCWWVLVRLAFRVSRAPEPQVAEHVDRARAGLGPLSRAQRRLIVILGATIAAWLLRSLLQWAWPGLAISDTAIAIIGAVALFVVPAGDWRGPPLLQWAATRDLPWNVLILVGGGLSLGTAIQDSGLAQAAATQIHTTAGWPTWAVLLSLAAATMALSHVTSNTATAATILPLAFATASSFDVGPAALGATVAMAASCAFMLPVASPPNAIVFASGHMRVVDMVRAGAVLSALSLGVIIVAAAQLVPLVLG